MAGLATGHVRQASLSVPEDRHAWTSLELGSLDEGEEEHEGKVLAWYSVLGLAGLVRSFVGLLLAGQCFCSGSAGRSALLHEFAVSVLWLACQRLAMLRSSRPGEPIQ